MHPGKRLGLISLGATAIWLVDLAPAAAQMANCGAARTRQMYEWCLGQQAQIYRQQSDYYNNMARQQWRQHQNIGRTLKYAPLIGPSAQRAWNVPRYLYQFRYGKP